MYQVYISSTYRDLKDFREIAAKAVRYLQCRAVAMEDYLASDERPLDRCLADVRASNVYVGLFAWRYGFTPPGRDRSITQLEYEEAGRVGIPRLIFLVDEAAAWPNASRDANSEAINKLRTALQERHLVQTFCNPDELDARLTGALSLELQKRGGSGKVDIPELLPYMNDRSRQRDQLADALISHRKGRPHRPFVAIAYGNEREAHSAFLLLLQQVTFPSLLGLSAEAGPVHHFPLSWIEPAGSLDERERRLQCRLAEVLTGKRKADVETLAREVAGHRCPVMISSSVLSVDWQKDEAELVQRWLKRWSEWPNMPPNQTLLIVLSFHLKDCSQLSFWTRCKLSKKNQSVCDIIATLDKMASDRLSVVTLDRLEAVREADVLNWLKEHAGKFCRESCGLIRDPLVLAEQIEPCVRKLFRTAEAADKSGGIPMEKLASELRKILHRCLNEGGN